MYKIAVSVICYDNEEEVLEYANKLSRQKGCDKIVLLVICNKCTNVKQLRDDLKKIQISSRVFEPGANLGYLRGCLYGFNAYNAEYEWAVISNTDIDFVSNDFFSKLLDNKYNSEIGCIGPDVILKVTQKHQNPFSEVRPGTMIMKMRKIIYSIYLLYKMYYWLSGIKGKIDYARPSGKSGYVYGVHGSLILLRKNCIDEFLKDDIQVFMYGEELYIAEKLKECHLLSFYDADLKIIHNENQVTGKIASRKKQRWCSQSINYLVDKYWN